MLTDWSVDCWYKVGDSIFPYPRAEYPSKYRLSRVDELEESGILKTFVYQKSLMSVGNT